jgi:hypothetical protein
MTTARPNDRHNDRHATPRPIQYPQSTLDRAERAVRCAPFTRKLYESVVDSSVSIRKVAGQTGIRSGYTRRAVGEVRAEDDLMWLIQVGLLRREVDGQGLTDSFRITPLGRQLIKHWHQTNDTTLRASWRDLLYNAIDRWLRLPI